jgi:putative spermidine/putrescine transport system substrate-binding protein
MFKTARTGDYFVPIDELKANVPNSADLWPFAFDNGHGITYLFSQVGYAYRKDLVDPPPTRFADFWEDRFGGKRATYITSNTLQMVFFMVASKVFGKDEMDMNAGFDAMQRAMPMKISDFTGNMQTLIERGEAVIVVQHDGEPYAQIDKGIPLGWMSWTERSPILDQTKTVSRWSEPMQKKLAYALIQRSTDPAYQEAIGAQLYERPTNSKSKIVDNLASKGVVNTADAAKQLWIPPLDWYLDNEQAITERVDKIFGA